MKKKGDKINVLPFLDTFGSRNKIKSVWKQETQQKVYKNKRKQQNLFSRHIIPPELSAEGAKLGVRSLP